MEMIQLILIAFVVTSITFTITVTSIFKWLRELISKIHPKLEELIHCPYCLGHYVTFAILPFTGVYRFTGMWFMDFLMSTFCIMGMVSIMHFVPLRAYKPIMRMMTERKFAKFTKNTDD